MKIPFNKAPICNNELENIKCVMGTSHLHGGGKFMKICEEKISELCDGHEALLTNSCTSALEIAAMMINIKSGDEVIIPSYTFVSTISAFVQRGAKPVFCDIRQDTLNIDETKIESLITKRTKAIVPVHYAGVSAEMDSIMSIAGKYNLYVIEDAAQALCSRYKDKALGTIGDFGTLSFHGTKNITCGEGGAILINIESAPDKNLSASDRVNFIREKGTNRIHFVNGKIDKYTWVDYGSSYIPSELNAAYLAAQLPYALELTQKRISSWNFYYNSLYNLEQDGIIKLNKVPEYCKTNAHIFFLLTESESTTNKLAQFLKNNGISAMGHYTPLHTSPMAKTLGCEDLSLPVAESSAKRILRLPMHSYLTEEELSYITRTIKNFFRG